MPKMSYAEEGGMKAIEKRLPDTSVAVIRGLISPEEVLNSRKMLEDKCDSSRALSDTLYDRYGSTWRSLAFS